MNRRDFIKSAGFLVAGLSVGRLVVPKISTESDVFRDTIMGIPCNIVDSNDMLFPSGEIIFGDLTQYYGKENIEFYQENGESFMRIKCLNGYISDLLHKGHNECTVQNIRS